MGGIFKYTIMDSKSTFTNTMLPPTFNYKLLLTCTWEAAMAKWLAGSPDQSIGCLRIFKHGSKKKFKDPTFTRNSYFALYHSK